ncbi:LysR family transcriptional regulator [Variovorax sp. AB1(2024)]|uniref:LysR family transcriptional regulator n=1 Tax=Variovorax sp. AB1(2024) TaxID=3132214 RepID=UPI0030B1660F
MDKTLDTAFDLNLLRVLVTLGNTRSVTHAASALGMSQSGFSSALARLRQLCGDPLFVRTADGMSPTPRAERMVETARSVLAQVAEGVLGQPEFDAATTRTEFRLAMADVAGIVFLPRLLRHFQVHAPHARVVCVTLPNGPLQQAMAAGEIDLALGYFPDLSAQSFFRQRLYVHTYACMVRKGHPLEGSRLTQKAYLHYGHADVASPARSNELFHRFLARRGLQRRIVLSTQHHMSLPAIIEATDLLATVPLATGARFAQLGVVQLLGLPFQPPTFPVHAHWHRLVQHDARNRWLRKQCSDLFNDATDEWRDMETKLYGPSLRSRRTQAPKPKTNRGAPRQRT